MSFNTKPFCIQSRRTFENIRILDKLIVVLLLKRLQYHIMDTRWYHLHKRAASWACDKTAPSNSQTQLMNLNDTTRLAKLRFLLQTTLLMDLQHVGEIIMISFVE